MDRNPEVSKEQHYAFGHYIRSIESQYFPCGKTGELGGIDGEMCTVVMFQICAIIRELTLFRHPFRYGLDIGHGGGAPIMIHFNYSLDLPMVGCEINEYRSNCAWQLVMKINEDETEGCKRIRGMSLLLQGDCNEVLVENLGNCPSLASLVNWFSNGFGIPDIIRCIQYLNTFWNLEWLITNMSQETLIGYGFEGRFLNPSKKFFGKLVKSSSGRTLYLHHLQRRSEFDGGKDICSKAEAIVVGAFRTNQPVAFARLQSNKYAENQKTSQSTRGARQSRVYKAKNSECPKFKMRRFKTYVDRRRISRLYEKRLTAFNLKYENTPGPERREIQKLECELKSSQEDSEERVNCEKPKQKSHSSAWGKCLTWLFGTDSLW